MKKRTKTVSMSAAVVVVVLAAGGAWADTPPPAADPAEAEWVQIRALKPIYEQAAMSGDVSKIAPYLSRDFSAATVMGSEVKGVEEFKAYYKRMRELIGKGGSYSLESRYEPGILLGDTAVAYGRTKEKVVTSERRAYRFSSLWTTVLRKEDGQWKLLRLHVSMDPIKNTFARSIKKRFEQLYAGAGLVMGTLFGFLLRGILVGRRLK